eukprot:scaffold31133_cov52-Attheya_sp.AAC.2
MVEEERLNVNMSGVMVHNEFGISTYCSHEYLGHLHDVSTEGRMLLKVRARALESGWDVPKLPVQCSIVGERNNGAEMEAISYQVSRLEENATDASDSDAREKRRVPDILGIEEKDPKAKKSSKKADSKFCVFCEVKIVPVAKLCSTCGEMQEIM